MSVQNFIVIYPIVVCILVWTKVVDRQTNFAVPTKNLKPKKHLNEDEKLL